MKSVWFVFTARQRFAALFTAAKVMYAALIMIQLKNRSPRPRDARIFIPGAVRERDTATGA